MTKYILIRAGFVRKTVGVWSPFPKLQPIFEQSIGGVGREVRIFVMQRPYREIKI